MQDKSELITCYISGGKPFSVRVSHILKGSQAASELWFRPYLCDFLQHFLNSGIITAHSVLTKHLSYDVFKFRADNDDTFGRMISAHFPKVLRQLVSKVK